jgi:hypothetical protein
MLTRPLKVGDKVCLADAYFQLSKNTIITVLSVTHAGMYTDLAFISPIDNEQCRWVFLTEELILVPPLKNIPTDPL